MKGTVRRRSKNSWEIRFDLPLGIDGKRRRQHLNVKGTKANAERRLRDLITQAEGGVPLDTSKQTVGAFLERWADTRASRVRQLTMYRYRNVLRLYVVPSLGDVRLTRLRPTEIESLYSSLTTRGISARTIVQLHRILKRAFRQAVRWNLIPRNPLDFVDPPVYERKESPTLDAEQLNVLLERTAEIRNGAAIYLGAVTGMRRGELAGVQWVDIDFDGPMVSVRRELVFVPGTGYLVTPPKSSKSRRAIDVTEYDVAVLRKHRALQIEERLKAGSAWRDEGWVFAKLDGNHINPNDLTKTFKSLREELGLPTVRLHDLRHTHATLLLQAGVHLKVVQERLGHSTIAITADTYSHVTAGMQKAAARQFADELQKGLSPVERSSIRTDGGRKGANQRKRLAPMKIGLFSPPHRTGGAQEGNRTPTPLREADFKSAASAVPPPGHGVRRILFYGGQDKPHEGLPQSAVSARDSVNQGRVFAPGRHTPQGLAFRVSPIVTRALTRTDDARLLCRNHNRGESVDEINGTRRPGSSRKGAEEWKAWIADR